MAQIHEKIVRVILTDPDIIQRFWLFPNRQGTAKINGHPYTFGLGTGTSDLIGFCKVTGKFVAIEVKTGKQRLTEQQEIFLCVVFGCKGLPYIAKQDFSEKKYVLLDFVPKK